MVVVVEEGSSPNDNNNTPLRITIFHYVKAIYVVFLASFCFQIACLSAYIGEFLFIKQHLAYLDILASGINVATTVSTSQVTQLNGLTLLECTKALIASFSLGVVLQILAFLYLLDLSIVKSKMQAWVLPLLLSLLACYTLLQWFYVHTLWPEKVLTGLRALFPNERLERVDYGILLLVQLGLTSLALIMSMAWTIRSIKRFCYYLPL